MLNSKIMLNNFQKQKTQEHMNMNGVCRLLKNQEAKVTRQLERALKTEECKDRNRRGINNENGV